MGIDRERVQLTPRQEFVKFLILQRILDEGKPNILLDQPEKISIETVRQRNRDLLDMAEQDLLSDPETTTALLSQVSRERLQLVNTFEALKGTLQVTLSILGKGERKLKIEYKRVISDLAGEPLLNLFLEAHISGEGNFRASLRKDSHNDSSQHIFQIGALLSGTNTTVNIQTTMLAEGIRNLFRHCSPPSRSTLQAA